MASKRASIMIVIALIRGELIMGQAWCPYVLLLC